MRNLNELHFQVGLLYVDENEIETLTLEPFISMP